jgi:glycosyltransferase involved in cell wall biosynthesis
MQSGLSRVTFLYWGRRGLSRFALDVARATLANDRISASISVSRKNESFAAFGELGEAVVPIETFSTNVGALLAAWRIPVVRKQLLQHMAVHRPQAVIELMPHVWSSFVAPAIKASGVRYVTIIHDASSHPGDYRSASIEWLIKRTLRQADLVLTLSGAVADKIEAAGQVPRKRIIPLFHPDLDFGGQRVLAPPRAGEPLRLAFWGRIMPYKGLGLFLDMVTQLREDGIVVEFGVYGEGDLGANARRLSAMGADVINRWLTEAEIALLLPQFHAVVVSHTEASQSGIVAAAFGAGLPVIATPVSGIIEQVEDGVTGVVARRVDAAALGEAAKRLLFERDLYSTICNNLTARRQDRSVGRFVEACVGHALSTI